MQEETLRLHLFRLLGLPAHTLLQAHIGNAYSANIIRQDYGLPGALHYQRVQAEAKSAKEKNKGL
ncbi:MAG TPA: hypothetical protein VNI77_00225 [Nitrososphaera sp.]|nr:hypothetical protein [Nitrososphaera sp.]